MGKYDDIINLPHHVSDYYKPMSMENRAAQFAPFAALTGHSEAIAETQRITEQIKELSDYEKTELSSKLSLILQKIFRSRLFISSRIKIKRVVVIRISRDLLKNMMNIIIR